MMFLKKPYWAQLALFFILSFASSGLAFPSLKDFKFKEEKASFSILLEVSARDAEDEVIKKWITPYNISTAFVLPEDHLSIDPIFSDEIVPLDEAPSDEGQEASPVTAEGMVEAVVQLAAAGAGSSESDADSEESTEKFRFVFREGFSSDAEVVSEVIGKSWKGSVPSEPGAYRVDIYRLAEDKDFISLNVVVMVPFDATTDRVEGKKIGFYPTNPVKACANLRIRSDADPAAYAPPRGFVRVTKEMLALQLSPHFQLWQFAPFSGEDERYQPATWVSFPKYMLVTERLINRLEFSLAWINAQYDNLLTPTFMIISGFRSPAYNAQNYRATWSPKKQMYVSRRANAATCSRHMFGDAADFTIDANRNGRIDYEAEPMMVDINSDGKVNFKDTLALQKMLERIPDAETSVEEMEPEDLQIQAALDRTQGIPSNLVIATFGDTLSGGMGMYEKHPYMLHIDTRGYDADWRWNKKKPRKTHTIHRMKANGKPSAKKHSGKA